MSKLAKLPALHVGDGVTGTMVHIHAATCSKDNIEGRGPIIDKSYHTSHQAALIASKGIDAMGSDGDVAQRLALRMSDGRYFLLQNEAHPVLVSDSDQDAQAATDLRTKALAKLSSPERAALGF
jgi:hypothetical protein